MLLAEALIHPPGRSWNQARHLRSRSCDFLPLRCEKATLTITLPALVALISAGGVAWHCHRRASSPPPHSLFAYRLWQGPPGSRPLRGVPLGGSDFGNDDAAIGSDHKCGGYSFGGKRRWKVARHQDGHWPVLAFEKGTDGFRGFIGGDAEEGHVLELGISGEVGDRGEFPCHARGHQVAQIFKKMVFP